MKIESFSFGNIIIDGKKYISDIIIFPDNIQSSWWRREGHFLQDVDLKEVLKRKPEKLIIGTGYYGYMKVDRALKKKLFDLGIEVFIEKTSKAVVLYNSVNKEKNVVAALHLTC